MHKLLGGISVEEYWADTLEALSDGQDMKDRENMTVGEGEMAQ